MQAHTAIYMAIDAITEEAAFLGQYMAQLQIGQVSPADKLSRVVVDATCNAIERRLYELRQLHKAPEKARA